MGNIGVILLEEGDYERAIETLDLALEFEVNVIPDIVGETTIFLL